MTRKPESVYIVDGILRSKEAEASLNEVLALCFQGEVGERALQYLRSISIEQVHGPNLQVNELIHKEGQRFIVGVIERRVHDGRNHKP